MEKGLDDILENWESYIQNTIRTGIELNWGDRTKELIKIYERSFNNRI
jgi:hypothetical protein